MTLMPLSVDVGPERSARDPIRTDGAAVALRRMAGAARIALLLAASRRNVRREIGLPGQLRIAESIAFPSIVFRIFPWFDAAADLLMSQSDDRGVSTPQRRRCESARNKDPTSD